MQHVTRNITIIIDDFEVSIFLTETSTRHALLTKHKHFHDTTQTKLTSNSGRLIGETNEAPIDVDIATELAPALRREESEEEDRRYVRDEGWQKTHLRNHDLPSTLAILFE